MKKVKRIQLKNVIFTAVKNRSILHGRVFVMCILPDLILKTSCFFLHIKTNASCQNPLYLDQHPAC